MPAQPLDSFIFPSSARSRLVQSSPGQDDHIRKIVEQCLHEYGHDQKSLSRRVAQIEIKLSRLSGLLGMRDDTGHLVDVTEARADDNTDLPSSTQLHAPSRNTEHQYAYVEGGPNEVGIRISQTRTFSREDNSELPRSMFSYCMWDLARSSEPWQSRGMLYLLFLIILQHILFEGFSESAVLADMKIHWIQRKDPYACMYGAYTGGSWHTSGASKLIWKQPWPVLLTGLAALFVVGLFLKAHYSEILDTVFPKNQGRAITCIVIYCVFVQFVHFPAVFTVNIATLVADCHDSMQILLTCVSVTFLWDVDNLLYDHGLRASEKDAYKRSSLRSEYAHDGWRAWLVTLTDVVLMGAIFLTLRFTDFTEEKYFSFAFAGGLYTWRWAWLVCSHGMFLAHALHDRHGQPGDESCTFSCLQWMLYLVGGFLISGIGGTMYWWLLHDTEGTGFTSLTLLHTCFS